MKINAINKTAFGNRTSEFDRLKRDILLAPAVAANTDIPQKESNKKEYKLLIIGAAAIAAGAACIFRGKISNLFSRKIKKPQKLYHMTSLENYNSIVRDGCIKKSSIDDGVFLSTIDDLKNKYPKDDFQRMLRWYGSQDIYRAGSASNKIVLLEIPITEPEKLSFRPICLRRSYLPREYDWSPFSDFGKDSEIHQKPLEYLYRGEIPTSAISKVREFSTRNIDPSNLVKEFWKKIKI